MSVKFTFEICHTADTSPFLEPWKMLLEIKALEETLTQYEIIHDMHPVHSARGEVPELLAAQIRHETGLENFVVNKYFFDQNKYLISLRDEETYILFKLAYYGTAV